MTEIRCSNCNKLLAKGTALELSIKCPRCGTFNTIRADFTDPEPPRRPKREGREPHQNGGFRARTIHS